MFRRLSFDTMRSNPELKLLNIFYSQLGVVLCFFSSKIVIIIENCFISDFMAGKDDGLIFRAALLSGAPGLGKTTTATLVCKVVLLFIFLTFIRRQFLQNSSSA